MKAISIFFCLVFANFVASAQKKGVFFDEVGNPKNWGVTALNSKIILFVRPDTNTKSISPFNSLPADPLGTVVYLNGATTAKVTTILKKDSVDYYRYSIIENDTVVKVWNEKLKKIDFEWKQGSSKPGYLTMNLGISNIQGKKIVIKIFRLPRVEEVSTLIIYNKPLPIPKLKEAYLVGKNIGPNLANLIKLVPDTQILVTDTTAGIFFKKQKTDLDFAQNVLLKYGKDKKSDTINFGNNWSYNSDDGNPIFDINVANFRKPGEYEILLQTATRDYVGYKQQDPVSVLKFTVLASPHIFSASDIILSIFGVMFIAAVILIFIRRANKKKQLALSLKADSAKSELNSVRAQLNPHFVFNALSGIQSLMNNSAVEQANNYLGKFANLTRQILDERELITVDDEIKLLKDYISMEQLRFPFAIAFETDKDESFRYTEIPTMLLQPFIENAVKHGVAPLKGDGKIVISIKKQLKDIVLSVEDNGKGFNRLKAHKGLGLKLSEKRIALLNENYKTCPIKLDIDFTSGTNVKIILTNWLT